MRCRELIERNGYFTGKRCSREATTVVTLDAGSDNEDALLVCCTQHANKLEAANHWREVTRRPIDGEVEKPVEDMLKRASARAEKSLQERNAAILLAFAEGASLREIGQAANMTHTAIKYIVDMAPNAEAVRAAREAQKAAAKEPQNQ